MCVWVWVCADEILDTQESRYMYFTKENKEEEKNTKRQKQKLNHLSIKRKRSAMKLWKQKTCVYVCDVHVYCFVWNLPKPRTYLTICHWDEHWTTIYIHFTILCTCARDIRYSQQRGCCAFVSSHIISITCQSCLISKAGCQKKCKINQCKASGSEKRPYKICCVYALLTFIHCAVQHCLLVYEHQMYGVECVHFLNCDLCHLCGSVWWYISCYNTKRYVNHCSHWCFEFLLPVRSKILTINFVSIYSVGTWNIDFLWHYEHWSWFVIFIREPTLIVSLKYTCMLCMYLYVHCIMKNVIGKLKMKILL